MAAVPPSAGLLLNTKGLNSPDLITFGDRKLYYKSMGLPSGKPTLFIHGLGCSHVYFNGLAEVLQSQRWLHLYDIEGLGLSPILASRSPTIDSFAEDAKAIMDKVGVSRGWTVIAHSMGAPIALKLAVDYQDLIDELVLMGPSSTPLPAANVKWLHARADTVRSQGISAIADSMPREGLSGHTLKHNPLALIAGKFCLLGQDPEAYAKACIALASWSTATIDVSTIKSRTLILTGPEDNIGPPPLCEKYISQIPNSKLVVLENKGHWLLFEDHDGVVDTLSKFLE